MIEDLDKKHHVLDYHLKLWADRYHCPGETKGGMVPLTHEKLIVTSQYHPNELFEAEETRAAINRRFQIHHFASLDR